MTNQDDALRRARDAVRSLERAVVELGPGRAQLCTYFSDLRIGRKHRALVLEPIAAEALPLEAHGPLTIHCESASGEFRLVCKSIERLTDHSAIVDLTGARLTDASHRFARYAVTRKHPLALVIPGGVQDGDGHVFPIVEISSDSCVVDATLPITPDAELGLVEIVGDHSVLRRAAAHVIDVIPWRNADGSRRFRCALRLESDGTLARREHKDILSDPLRVQRVMEFAALAGVTATFEAPVWGEGHARFGEAEHGSLLIEFGFTGEPDAEDPRYVSLRFELFSVNYEVTLRVMERRGTWVRAAMPLHLSRERAFHRELHVAGSGAPDHAVSLSFRNPVTGQREERDISELSFQSVTFDASSARDLLWQGLPLEEAFVHAGADRIRIGETRIDDVTAEGGRGYARVPINRASISQDPKFVNLVTSLGHPNVSVHDGQNFNAMLAIYKQAGLFAPHMRRNLDPIMPAAKRVWHRLHRGGPELVQTLQHGPLDAPDGAVTALRPWEHAFVAQHFVSISAQSSTAAGRLQLAYVDHVQARPEAHYLVFFVKSDNKQMNAFYERFFATTGTPEAIERRSVYLWCRSGELPRTLDFEPAAKVRVRGLHAAQEAAIARAAERRLGPQGSAALSLLPGEFHIPTTAAAFAKLGLRRKRVCDIVTERSVPMYATIEEITSPGLNFTWMLNASWLLPVHAERDESRGALKVALQHIVQKRVQTPTGDIFLNSVDGIDEDALRWAGFEKLAEVYMYTMNRAGLNRYFYYTSDRYGEVDLRTQQRGLRRLDLERMKRRA